MKNTYYVYTLVMYTDRGWMFLEPDGFTLTTDPLKAIRFESFVAATVAAHGITDTDCHIEVIDLDIAIEYEFPKEAMKRRTND